MAKEENVVVWCRNQKIYNDRVVQQATAQLWFDVGIKRYTTGILVAEKSVGCGLM